MMQGKKKKLAVTVIAVALLALAAAAVLITWKLAPAYREKKYAPQIESSLSPGAKEPEVEPKAESEPEPAPEEFTESGLSMEYARLVLVNESHPLSAEYVPELAQIPSELCNGQLRQIDSAVLPYLLAMIEAGKADGVNLLVRSPYRSYAVQTTLFQNQVTAERARGLSEQDAIAAAATAVAMPGTSEHQTGLAVDLNSTSSSFEYSREYRWMLEHAAEYGFILRYPLDKTEITGIIYEPWHYRFVGIKTAREIRELGVCYEEYCALKGVGEERP